MKFIKGQNRTQSFLFPVSLEQSIAQDNEVRVIVCYILSIFAQIRLILKRSAECIFFKYICKLNFDYCLNRLIFEQNINKSRGF